jgi:hypothetical protein
MARSESSDECPTSRASATREPQKVADFLDDWPVWTLLDSRFDAGAMRIDNDPPAYRARPASYPKDHLDGLVAYPASLEKQ